MCEDKFGFTYQIHKPKFLAQNLTLRVAVNPVTVLGRKVRFIKKAFLVLRRVLRKSDI